MKFIPLPQLSDVARMLAYDPENGVFLWRESPNWSIKPGERAGNTTSKGYVEISLFGRRYKAHRLAWLLMTGRDPSPMEIDHKDRCRSNNRFKNLRLATRKLNNENISTPITNTSGRRGVSFNKFARKWTAYVYEFKRKINLGSFDNFEDAAAARAHGEAIYVGITPPADKGEKL